MMRTTTRPRVTTGSMSARRPSGSPAPSIARRALAAVRLGAGSDPTRILRAVGYNVLRRENPQTGRTIDLVVGPTGVFTVETIRCNRKVRIAGGSLQDRKHVLDGVLRETRDAAQALQAGINASAAGIGVTPIPVLAIHHPGPDRGRRAVVRGVTVCTAKELFNTVTSRRTVLDSATIEAVATTAQSRFGYFRR